MKAQLCPYLGLRDDSDTAFSFPSTANHCFRLIPVTAVKLDHQREFCLSGKNPLCEVFRGEPGRSKKRFKDVVHRPRRVRQLIRNWLFWLFPTLIIMASIFGLVLIKPGRDLTSSPGINSEKTPTMLIESTKTPPLSTQVPSPSATVVVSTSTPTMVVVRALDIPIGIQNPLVIHQVREGESMSFLAKHSNTTEEAIISLNYNLSLPLWPKVVIVIPLNQVYVNNLPLFEPYRVTEAISPQALAANFSIDIEMLMVYNLVDPEYVFTVGEWVLIPHLRIATPTG